jgi:hypothetical protein
LSLLAASFFSLRFFRNEGVRNFDFFSFFASSAPVLLTLVRIGEAYTRKETSLFFIDQQ